MALPVLTSCAVKIHDYQFCAVVPGSLGAVCDNFLTANQQILDQQHWEALQAQWIADGSAVECTTSNALGDIKGEIEKLCSVAKCDYDMKQKLLSGAFRIRRVAKQAVKISRAK